MKPAPEEPLVESREAPPETGAPEIHLAEYWAVLVKRRVLVALVVCAAAIASIVISFLSKSEYKATVVINVEKDKGSPLDIGGSQAVYYEYYTPEFVPTQTRLMKSRQVAERTVQRLNLVENPEFNPGVKGSASASLPADAVVRSALGILKNLETTPVRGANLVELSYTGGSPKLAADIANALADAYIEWGLEAKYKVVGQASQFLGAQIEQLKAEVEEAERRLQAYGRSKDIVSMDPQSNITMQKLETLNRDYTAAVGDRVSKEARYYEVQTAKPEAIAETFSGGLVTQLRNDQLKLERDYAEKLNLFKPEWPALQQLKAQIQKGKQHLDTVIQETVAKARDTAQTDYQTAQRKEENLKEVLRSQKAEAMTLNTDAVEYNNLKVEVSTKRTLMDTLLKRQSETEVSSRLSGSRQSTIRIVDRALVPTSRFRPSYRRNGLLGIFFGLAGGVGLAFFLEYMDRSIRGPEQVEKFLGLPPLGLIPAVGTSGRRKYGYGYRYLTRYGRRSAGKGYTKPDAGLPAIEMLPHSHPRSTTSEAYRAFRAALLFSRAGGVSSIVVTSGFPGEGKTTTAINLAIVLAQLGKKKVLLLDADLHKPRLHEILKVSNRVGLVSILTENLEPTRAIFASEVEGLYVLASGPGTPNPSGLLASEQMTKLLKLAKTNFDYVVIDTPPIQAVADAILLGHQTDGVVLCVQGGETPRDLVARVRDRLLQSNVRILGVLINNLRESEAVYGDKYYYAGYKLGYAEEPKAADAANGAAEGKAEATGT